MHFDKLMIFARKQKWILTELRYVCLLGIVGALGYASDTLQAKMGTIFIARTSGEEIGKKVSALFIGQAIMGSTSYMVIQGIGGGMNTLCSQAYGAANYKLMGTYFMRALTIASLTCFPIWSLWLSVEPIIYYITGETELAQDAGDYTTVLCFGYPAYIYTRLAANFLQSQNIISPNLAILVCGNLLNICFQYILVVVLSLQIKGVALAYTLSNYLTAILLFAYIRFTGVHLTYSIFSWSYLTGWYHFLKYGLIGALQLMIDVVGTRTVPIIFIGFILKDTDQMAVLGILNVMWVLCASSAYGLGIGANVRVGNLLGENNLKKAKKTTIVTIFFIIIIVSGFGLFTFSFSYYISCIFTSVEYMRAEIELGFKILSIGLVSDMGCCLKGLCNACCLQNHVLISQILSFLFIAIPFGCGLAYFVPWKAGGYFIFLSAGYLASAATYILLLYCYDWKKIANRVSENIAQRNIGNFSDENTKLTNNSESTQKDNPKYTKFLFLSRYMFILITSSAIFMYLLYIRI